MSSPRRIGGNKLLADKRDEWCNPFRPKKVKTIETQVKELRKRIEILEEKFKSL